MKESRRAVQHEINHEGCVAAFKVLLGEDHEKVKELEDLHAQRLPPPVRTMEELGVIRDVLQQWADEKERTSSAASRSTEYPLSSIDQDVADALADAGYNTTKEIREASDEDLLAVKGIGPAKLSEIRTAVG